MNITLTLTPAGKLQSIPANDEKANIQTSLDKKLLSAFSHSQASGLLQLLNMSLNDSPVVFKYWRDFIAQYASLLCHY